MLDFFNTQQAMKKINIYIRKMNRIVHKYYVYNINSSSKNDFIVHNQDKNVLVTH